MLSVARPARQPCTGGSTSKPGRGKHMLALALASCQLRLARGRPSELHAQGLHPTVQLATHVHGAHSGSGGDWGEGESPRVSRGRRLVCKCSARALTIASLRIAAGRLQCKRQPPPKSGHFAPIFQALVGRLPWSVEVGSLGIARTESERKTPRSGQVFR